MIENAKKEISIAISYNNITKDSFNNIHSGSIDIRFNSPTIIYQNAEPSAEQLMLQGKNLSNSCEYESVVEKFRQMVKIDSNYDDVYYYIALSIINGKGQRHSIHERERRL